MICPINWITGGGFHFSRSSDGSRLHRDRRFRQKLGILLVRGYATGRGIFIKMACLQQLFRSLEKFVGF